MVNSRSKGEIKALTSDLKKVLKELYGDRLVEIILYGSFARGEANADSDIDIAIVLKGRVNKFQELDRLLEGFELDGIVNDPVVEGREFTGKYIKYIGDIGVNGKGSLLLNAEKNRHHL